MKASFREKYCYPSQIRLIEIPKPTPKADEVLVKVMTTTVNRTDLGVSTGKPYAIRAFTGITSPKIQVTGTDFAGVIEATGSEVSDFKVGDCVWGFDDNGAGTHAEWVAFSTKKALIKMPDNRDFAFMAACAEAAHYAVNFINKVKLKPGMQVLVNGGTGAIGSAAIQILKAMEIEVTAVCFERDVEVVKTLGPDRVIALEKNDFTKEDKAYDFVFDAVGKSSYFKCRKLLKPKGVYVSTEFGYLAQNVFLTLLTPLFGGKKVKFPIVTDSKSDIVFFKELIESGKYRAVIDRRYLLSEIVEATKYVELKEKIGNVVIDMP